MGGVMTTDLCSGDEIPLLEQEHEGEIELTDEATSKSTIVGAEGGSDVRTIRTKHRTPVYVFVLAFLSAIGGFLFGYDTGVVAGATLPIAAKFSLSTVEKELFVSITVAAAAVFAIVGGILNDKIGRKPTTLLASLVFAVGAIVLSAATGKATLLIGRFILGIGIGFASMTVPIYIAEAAPPDLRGQLVSLNQAFIAGGMFVSLISAGAFCPLVNGWRFMLGLAAVPAIIQFIGFLFMPESPRWLVHRGKDELAIKILRRLRGTTNVEAEYQAIKSACDEEIRAREVVGHQLVVVKVFNHPPVLRALIIGCALQLFQQITGINTIMYYSATIIRMAGVEDNCTAIWYASITAFANFIFTFVGIALVERIGRRILFISSLVGVTVCLVFLGIAFQVEAAYAPSVTQAYTGVSDACAVKYMSCEKCIEDQACGFCFDKTTDGGYQNTSCLLSNSPHTASLYSSCSTNLSQSTQTPFTWAYDYCPTPYSWMAVLGMILYLSCFSPGMGPMPWTINSEIYPLWARSFCNSLTTFTNWLFNLIISMTFLSLSEAITRQGAFYLYATFGFIGSIFFFLFLPETRGRSLEEMESLFSGSWFVRSKKRNRNIE